MALRREIALIDLDRRHIDTLPISVDIRNRFLGGAGIATYLLCKHAPKKRLPESAESVCVISAGLLGGTLCAPQGYTILTANFGSTDLMARACLKGPFAAEMRQAGFDHLVFKGRAKRKTYLFIHDGRIEFVVAPDFAGKPPIERRQILHGGPCKTATRGLPAGKPGCSASKRRGKTGSSLQMILFPRILNRIAAAWVRLLRTKISELWPAGEPWT